MKPIIMSTEDVRAVLDGRKTMTRRVIKPRHGGDLEVHSDIAGTPRLSERCGDRCRGLIPPYEVGDVLWVRETFARHNKGVAYKADSDQRKIKILKGFWEPPLHMPREDARLFLRVKDVRVERVQDITVVDAGREGFEGFHHKNPMLGNLPEIVWNFKNEWDSRNAKRGYGWDTNPFCWVIEFECVEKGVELE